MLRNTFFRALVLCSLSLGLSSCGIFELKDKLLDAIVAQVPFSWEQSLGQQLRPSILPDSAMIKDPRLQSQLVLLLEPLISPNTSPDFPIKIYISRDPALNAFAIPGGILIFNAGMLLAVSTPEEILGVAAHELAHATQRHVMRSMVQNLGLAAALTIFLGDLSGLAGFLLQQGQLLLQKGFSRQQEADADKVGFDYLVKSKIDPRGMAAFFERLQKVKEQRGATEGANSRIQNFYSTHPLTQDRIDNIERLYQELSPAKKRSFRASRFDLKSFQARLKDATQER